ncbi:LysR family transcriptional regulator [Thioclava sp. GXIMD2076]|uniref:LysR family transcriptional regulator n=1 Tax=Thioclava kandeliae TaxID=3070818 RepID=A0ABV1SHW0_9RHOB
MDTRDLQIFLSVIEEGSITKAAAKIGTSQPSVSRTVQDLEAELGFALLHRVGRGIQITEEGLAFGDEARRLLMSFGELAARAKMIAAGRGRILQVASISAIGTSLIPAALADLGTAGLPQETHVGQFLPSVVVQEVRSGRAELGYCSLPLDTSGVEVLRLYSAPDAIALREDDPLAAQEVVPVDSLANRLMVTMLNPLRFQMHVARVLAARGVQVGQVIRTNISYAALQIVSRTGAAAIIDPVSAWGMNVPGVVIRPIDAEVPFYWGVLTAKGRPLSATAMRLADQVEANAERLIPGFARLDPALAGGLTPPAPEFSNYGTET